MKKLYRFMILVVMSVASAAIIALAAQLTLSWFNTGAVIKVWMVLLESIGIYLAYDWAFNELASEYDIWFFKR